MYNNVSTSSVVGVSVIVLGLVYLGYSKYSEQSAPSEPQNSYPPTGGSRRRNTKHNKTRKYK